MAPRPAPAEPPVAPMTIDECEARIAALRAKGIQVAADRDALKAERHTLALGATGGDKAAMARVGELNARDVSLSQEQDLLDVAGQMTTDRLTQARQEAADALSAAQRARLIEGTTRVKMKAAGVDATGRDHARAWNEYFAELDGLRSAGLDATYHGKLRNRTMMAGAMHTAGLSAHVGLPPVSPHHRTTLENWVQRMLGHLLAPPPAAGPATETEAA